MKILSPVGKPLKHLKITISRKKKTYTTFMVTIKIKQQVIVNAIKIFIIIITL